MIDAHPALKAVSPQAPIADWFFDDFFHHGAFFLPHAFNFLSGFGQARPEPTTKRRDRASSIGTPDGYSVLPRPRPAQERQRELLTRTRSPSGTRSTEHPNYDEFWQARNLLPHLKNVRARRDDRRRLVRRRGSVRRAARPTAPSRSRTPASSTSWSWARGRTAAGRDAGRQARQHRLRRDHVRLLPEGTSSCRSSITSSRARASTRLPEAAMFETGANRWRKFDNGRRRAPPAKKLYFHAGGKSRLSSRRRTKATHSISSSAIRSRPVPYTEAIATGMTREYMTDDQRFALASGRTCWSIQTEPLKEDLTLAGPMHCRPVGLDHRHRFRLDRQADRRLPAGHSPASGPAPCPSSWAAIR